MGCATTQIYLEVNFFQLLILQYHMIHSCLNSWMWNHFMGKTCIRRANSMLHSNSQLQGGQILTATLCKGQLYLVIHPVWCHRNFTMSQKHMPLSHNSLSRLLSSLLIQLFQTLLYYFCFVFSLNHLNIWLWSAVFYCPSQWQN